MAVVAFAKSNSSIPTLASAVAARSTKIPSKKHAGEGGGEGHSARRLTERERQESHLRAQKLDEFRIEGPRKDQKTPCAPRARSGELGWNRSPALSLCRTHLSCVES